ncbi:hypothetical protein DKM27_26090 [Mycobacterium tuberculosis variant bovis]|nr:hypothetical protein DKM27_26090 [Mycobacterium tuberculosis variant bovis]
MRGDGDAGVLGDGFNDVGHPGAILGLKRGVAAVLACLAFGVGFGFGAFPADSAGGLGDVAGRGR